MRGVKKWVKSEYSYFTLHLNINSVISVISLVMSTQITSGTLGLKLCIKYFMGCIMQKGPECPESWSYQQKDGRTGPRPPFFWYDTDFLEFFFFKFLICFFFQKKSKKSVATLLLVWQRLRTLGTFSRNAAQLFWHPRPKVLHKILCSLDKSFTERSHGKQSTQQTTNQNLIWKVSSKDEQ